MTTYTAITNGQIDQDSPITQPLMTALRDNPIALAEGASGAPRINGSAIARDYGSPNLPVVTVSAGDNISQQGEGFVAGITLTQSTTEVVGLQYTIKSYSGTLRFNCTHSSSNSTSTLSIYKNDVLIQSYTTNITPVARSNDVSVSVGDVVEWRHKISNAAHTSVISGYGVGANNPYVQQVAYRLRSEGLT